jgi:hypothetical protein
MIVTKRAYEPAAAADGYRVLIDRLWPARNSSSEAQHLVTELERLAFARQGMGEGAAKGKALASQLPHVLR